MTDPVDSSSDVLIAGSSDTLVAGGRHIVPEGVAVEELDGGKKKLSEHCPPELQKLLAAKDLVPVYDAMVTAICEAGKTRNLFGAWRDGEFVAILDMFRDRFAEKGVRVALCRRKSGSGTKRWLEFIDVEKVAERGGYVPQFDVANFSGQVIKTMYTKLEFPNGVAAEQIKEWGGRKKLKEAIPVEVVKMMTAHDLMPEYEALVAALIAVGNGTMTNWDIEKLVATVNDHRPGFEAKGVAVFVCHKQEYVSHGQYGGHNEMYRWIEFVDRALQPNYAPQRDAQVKGEKCCIM